MTATAEPVARGLLQLHRVDADHWVVHDYAYRPGDARHVVASVRDTGDDFVEVVWVPRDIPLPTRYRVAEDVLEDLTRWRSQRKRMTRPVQIPHLPPLSRFSRRA